MASSQTSSYSSSSDPSDGPAYDGNFLAQDVQQDDPENANNVLSRSDMPTTVSSQPEASTALPTSALCLMNLPEELLLQILTLIIPPD
ncbi:hypothetical protein LTR56_015482 [Elasticomyces elasticus]|nr:hypothetical protein LTR56_015482 [Elasticomyces elasticus]KAK3662515.1 hypothetical protein LTR22_006581 [Elasticomyces elasticus]KAK4927859.1 hypothetical protein LTR49_005281 [Elasticomyces elasticus]KAK5736676.1 hypothetical protein LTS12_026108 [Elasticomyces elasticus]